MLNILASALRQEKETKGIKEHRLKRKKQRKERWKREKEGRREEGRKTSFTHK